MAGCALPAQTAPYGPAQAGSKSATCTAGPASRGASRGACCPSRCCAPAWSPRSSLDQAKPFRLAISLSRVEIADAGINLPAAALGLGMPKLAPLRLTGEVRVSIPHLSLERGRMDGDATLQWRSAGSALTPISPLGEYEMQFKAVGPDLHATLRTLEGRCSSTAKAPGPAAARRTFSPPLASRSSSRSSWRRCSASSPSSAAQALSSCGSTECAATHSARRAKGR